MDNPECKCKECIEESHSRKWSCDDCGHWNPWHCGDNCLQCGYELPYGD